MRPGRVRWRWRRLLAVLPLLRARLRGGIAVAALAAAAVRLLHRGWRRAVALRRTAVGLTVLHRRVLLLLVLRLLVLRLGVEASLGLLLVRRCRGAVPGLLLLVMGWGRGAAIRTA